MKLHVHEWGDPGAPPVVCLHGVQAFGLRFRRLAEERLARRFHILAPDLRGHGRSGWDEPWTLEAHLEDLLETVPHLGVWIGHSFGGRLVAEMLAARPDLVERAVLLDPALAVPADYADLLAEQERSTDGSFASVDEAVAATLAEHPRASQELLAAEIREQLMDEEGRVRCRYSPEAVAAGFREVARPMPSWWQAGVPTLLIAATESKFVSLGEAAVYGQGLGDRLKIEVVPGGHSVLWDAFDETAGAIEAFLNA